jgi:hypothetical protein
MPVEGLGVTVLQHCHPKVILGTIGLNPAAVKSLRRVMQIKESGVLIIKPAPTQLSAVHVADATSGCSMQ